MKKHSRWTLALLLGALLLSIGGTLAALVHEPWLSRVRVGNATLTLAGATYGTEHTLKPWHWWEYLPWSPTSGQSCDGMILQSPALVVWVHRPASGNSVGYGVLRDIHGCRFPRREVASWHRVMAPPRLRPGGMEAAAYLNYPRRQPYFQYTYYGRKRQQPWGSLSVRNPDPQQYPEWTPAPFPVTQRYGKWQFSLTGIEELPAGDWWNSAAAQFEVTHAGRPAPVWQPIHITLSDATGNRVSTPAQEYPRPGFVTFPGLCFEEKAWRLDVQFGPSYPPRLPADLTWEVEVPNPAPRVQLPFNTSCQSGSTILRLVQVRHPYGVADLRMRQVRLRVQSPTALQVALTEVRDESGRVRLSIGRLTDREHLVQNHAGGTQDYSFTIPDVGTARRLRLKFQAYHLVSASFLAEP